MKTEYANEILVSSQSGYETIATDFSRTRRIFWNELLFVRDLIPKGSRLLDIGCGNGRFLGAPLDVSIDYAGIDFSESLIDVAKERYSSRSNTTFVVGDALNLPLPDHSFDMTVSFAVIHHIPSRACRVQFLREAARVVKPNGLIILTAWNVWRTKPWAILKYAVKKIFGLTRVDFGDAFLGFGKEKNARYVHAFSKRELYSLAQEAELLVEKFDIIRRPSGEENFYMLLRRYPTE